MMKRTVTMMLLMMMMTVVFVIGPIAAAAGNQEDLTTTLDEIFFQRYHIHIEEMISIFTKPIIPPNVINYRGSSGPQLTAIFEVVKHATILVHSAAYELTKDLGTVPVKSLTNDLTEHCYPHLEQPLVDLREELTNTTCVTTRLRDRVTLMVKRAIEVSLKKVSRDCVEQFPALCSRMKGDCTRDYGARLRQLTSNYLQDVIVVDKDGNDTLHKYVDEFNYYFNGVEPMSGKAPLDIVVLLFVDNANLLDVMAINSDLFDAFILFISTHLGEPFTFVNVVNPWGNVPVIESPNALTPVTKSQNGMTWGIIRSSSASVDLPCSHYRYSGKNHTREILRKCYREKSFQSNSKLLLCVYSEPSESPLTWSLATSLFFHSACLCVAANGTDCSVKAPLDVDLRFYCLSILLRDFQRQVTYRPAITYLDYAFQTRLTVCNIANFLSSSYRSECKDINLHVRKYYVTPSLCFFKDLVNKDLNCSETLIIEHYNYYQLCEARFIMELVACEDKANSRADVTYYKVGDSHLVLFLTFSDIVLRVLTLVTFLMCPQLSTLQGNAMICYLSTSALRLLVVRTCVSNLNLAVRLDVAMDLASTLWLTAYLLLQTSIIENTSFTKYLRQAKPCMVLLWCALLCWLLPATLSTALFLMDEVLGSHVQVGQVLLIFFNYAALFANFYMFYLNFLFIYNFTRRALSFRQSLTRYTLVGNLIIYTLKTSLMTGLEIIIRLILTHFEGMEHVLSYYHALSSLQGLLLFLLYGCCAPARAFWISVYQSILCRHRFISTLLDRNSIELEPIEVPQPLKNCSSASSITTH